MNNILSTFSNKYQLSKTLRFELKPIGKTLEHIQTKELISEDDQRAKSYQKMKKTIDGFHKHFIELAMSTVKLTKLETFQELFNASPERKKEESYKKELEKVQDSLRKEIVKGFSTGEAKEIFAKIDKKELITELLEQWIQQQKEDDFYFDEKFKNFTTYFGGFHENRKNMYSDKAQSTAIAYRLIHENLPKFLENIKIFEKIKSVPEVYEKCQTLYKEIEEYLNITKIDEAFELDYYNEVLTQKQIDIYNLIIVGRTASEGKTKIQGLNEYINLYNQKQEKNKRIPKLKILYKQILSDRVSTSFTIDKFTKDLEVLDAIENYYKFDLLSYQPKDKEDAENVLERVKEILAHLADYDLSKIYLRNDTKITNISQKMFGKYGVFSNALAYYYSTVLKPNFIEDYKNANTKKREKLDKEQEQFLKQEYLTIDLLQNALGVYIPTLDPDEEIVKRYTPQCVADYFKDYFKAEKEVGKDKEFGLIVNISNKYSCIQGLLGTDYPEDKKLVQQKEELFNIKAFLDSLMELLHFVKPLSLPNDSVLEKDQNFYGQFEPWMEQLNGLIPLYNKVRNYATQKPYSEEKFKLNFENSTLLDGWDVNKEEANTSVLLRKDGFYYLAIMDKNTNYLFEYESYEAEKVKDLLEKEEKLKSKKEKELVKLNQKTELSDKDKVKQEKLKNQLIEHTNKIAVFYLTKTKTSETVFEKIDYKFFPEASKMIPKCSTQLNAVKNHFKKKTDDFIISGDKFKNNLTVSKRIFDLNNYVYDAETNSLVKPKEKDEKRPKLFQREYLEQSGNNEVYKNALRDWISFCKNFLSTYDSTSVYEFSFDENPPFDSLDSFYTYINTITYKVTFRIISEMYINQLVESGKLYLFQIYNKDFSTYSKGKPNMHTMYWKALFDEENLKDVVYKLNGQAEVFFRKSSIKNPVVHKANEAVANKNPLAEKKESVFDYDLIKDKRYTIDKFQFHVPITINFKATGKEFINQDVLDFLHQNPDVNIIGLDRGERHLIYLTLINQKGEIILQESLNNITAENHPITTSYHELLNRKEKERDEARKSWGTIENIKELKEGYISQVVHKIAKLMVQYNAIVVIEDLNFGFKRGRFKVEKQVYQKLEKMLIDKLNYLVFKEVNPKEPGGLYNALQLTNKFTSFKEMGKQSGFLFYVPAWNTSKIDPTTGFVNLFDTRYENLDKAKTFISKFEDIRFNPAEKYFEFVVENYSDFNAKAEGTKQDWTICSFGERIKTFRNPDANNQWDNKVIQLTEEWKALFEKYKIDYKTELKEQILQQTEAGFFKAVLDLFKLTLQMRNSITNSEVDYLISPVKNKQGVFFDSRKADATQPKDADANGAYHIAKKGLMWLEQIKSFNGTDWKKLDLDKSNKGWLQFIQNKK
ncbi:MAG: type V CRISPR-associated protein Cas12a/Cpf1 [Bacteroidetes bacterium]|nr:type V CRISPR-associated protein Cas12a/Cpf1 [Bacteroidota bacterium]